RCRWPGTVRDAYEAERMRMYEDRRLTIQRPIRILTPATVLAAAVESPALQRAEPARSSGGA
ncbi:MAG: hypothetical protein J2P17_33965, partial [Mycobacterium sp.]|nr:hypothetical protein [Mycobacterium sp.]